MEGVSFPTKCYVIIFNVDSGSFFERSSYEQFSFAKSIASIGYEHYPRLEFDFSDLTGPLLVSSLVYYYFLTISFSIKINELFRTFIHLDFLGGFLLLFLISTIWSPSKYYISFLFTRYHIN
jgi:hypothetical protein